MSITIETIKDKTKACYNCVHMSKIILKAGKKIKQLTCVIDNRAVMHNDPCRNESNFFFKRGK